MLKIEFLFKDTGKVPDGYSEAVCKVCARRFAYPPGKILMVGEYVCEDCIAAAQSVVDEVTENEKKKALGE